MRRTSTTEATSTSRVPPLAIRTSGFLIVWLILLVVAVTPGLRAAEAAPTPADDTPRGVWPLVPVPQVVHGFAPPSVEWGQGHRGVDLAGWSGQPVRAALAGKVRFVGKIAGKPVVVIGHGDTRTTYEPVLGQVARGTEVAAGQQIGTLSVPFSHCFPSACLHWGWRRGETYLDPLALVGAGPVRLLPLPLTAEQAPP